MKKSVALAAAVAALLGAGVAFAKAPKPADTPTVEELFQKAKSALDKGPGGAGARDENKDAIEAYKDKVKTQLTDYGKLVDIIKDDKDERIQSYRAAATNALIIRFQSESDSDAAVRAVRRDIANKILDLMKAPAKDTVGLAAIEQILYAWWKGPMQIDVKFKANDKPDARKKAYDKMKKFLKSES